MNDLDRFHLVGDVIDRPPPLEPKAGYVKQALRDKLIDPKEYICRYDEDLPEIRDWWWERASGESGNRNAFSAANTWGTA